LRRFPLRTLILMFLALIVFVRMWIITHKPKEPASEQSPEPPGMAVDVVSPSGTSKAPSSPPSPACNTLERALDAVVRNPADVSAVAGVQRQLEECQQPPARACELGDALDAQTPPGAEPSPARELLKALCQRCPAEANTCAGIVARTLVTGTPGRARTPEEVRWYLENAGPGTAAVCATLVGSALVPAAVTGGTVNPAHPPLVTALAPVCAKAGHLPASIVHAAAVQRGSQAGDLVALVAPWVLVPPPRPDAGTPADAGPTAPALPSSSTAPEQITGPEPGRQAFDGKEETGVDLGNEAKGPRWEADGALRAQFDPPLKQLLQLRLRAKGPGTLRAIVRTPRGVGMQDKERGTFFVNPTVCQFQGTGQWETCNLMSPLVDVEALSVFPSQPKVTLHEVDVRGTR
jgi:hypothetical protein